MSAVCAVIHEERSGKRATRTREGRLGAVKGGDGKVVGRLDEGLGALDNGLGGLEGANGEVEAGLVEVGGKLSRLDKLPRDVSACVGRVDETHSA